MKYNALLQENDNIRDIHNDVNENMNHLLYINDKLKYDASSFSMSYEETKKINSLLNEHLSNAKNEIAIKNAQLSTLSDREKSMREILWLAIRKAKGDSNIPSSLTHLGVLLQYAIENFILSNHDVESKPKVFSSSLTMISNSTYSTPMTSAPRLSGNKSSQWTFESPSIFSSPVSRREIEPTLDDSIKQQRSILSNFKESI
jgi:hypothetical protein